MPIEICRQSSGKNSVYRQYRKKRTGAHEYVLPSVPFTHQSGESVRFGLGLFLALVAKEEERDGAGAEQPADG